MSPQPFTCWKKLFALLLVLVAQLSHSFQPISPTAPQRVGTTARYTFSSSEDYPGFTPPQGYQEFQEFDEAIDDDNRLSDEDLEATLTPWDPLKPQFNTVHLTGRIGNDPEARYLDEGKVVVNLSLACRRKYHYMERQYLNIKSGDEETDWYGLEIWGLTAEFVAKYVEKGMRVGVIGSLQEDKWIDKETQEPRNRVKVVVREFDILESRAEGDLRRQRSGSNNYGNNNQYGSGGGGGGPSSSSAGTGGFFDS
ncbi:Single-stranded DNA-binding protein [Seminavis robusta]|uniref:Single-stranded DNA-binding protein n=1 Tax=Seminavis robusta TaxID=568900 RepID=A0A9N8DSP0_9STRA|nr:Single-stranded DNA-binding protein [Seminavis robusta]|eukprot:Sro253_g099790.1 Single-stranded DNA-binding protein (253) ;mRNA; r:18451-19209